MLSTRAIHVAGTLFEAGDDAMVNALYLLDRVIDIVTTTLTTLSVWICLIIYLCNNFIGLHY